jgi:hypothetical protein
MVLSVPSVRRHMFQEDRLMRALGRQGELRAPLVSRPPVLGFHICPKPSMVGTCEIRLVEINRPLDLSVASLAERSQIPR